ncbi:MAG: gliding motility-associated C-terminal domain-containing protein [Bacteroidales bacterium]|nr:gliding motility-associated C-terminal domain-containing protein [Bacteroidales bacterium]
MKNTEISMNDMENIKKILSDYEVPYDHNDWIKLEKDLPKYPGMISMTKILLVATAIILSIAGIYLLTQHLSKNKTDNNISQKINNNSNSHVVSIESDDATNNLYNKSDNSDSNNNFNRMSVISNSDSNNNNDKVIITDFNNEDEEIQEVINKSNNQSSNTNNSNNDNQIPDINKAVFNVEIIDNCVPSKIVFTAENVPSNCEIIWNTGDSYRAYGYIAEYSYMETGKYSPTVNIVFNNFVIKTEKLDEIIINQPSVIKINFENSENLYYFTCNNKEELSIIWSIDNQQFSEKDISYEFNLAGEHLIMLTAINEFGCKSEVTEKINTVIEHIFYVPNAFIPTSNGVNSEFGPIGENMDFATYKMVIVDASGNTVFESTSPEFMWNGRINNIGDEAKPGFYLWEIITMDKFGNVQTKKGRVNLIRN